VSRHRSKLESSLAIEKIDTREVTRGGVTYEQKTENIGQKEKKVAPIRNVRIYCPDNELHSFKCGRCVKCGEDGRGNVAGNDDPCANGHDFDEEACRRCHEPRPAPPPEPESPYRKMFADLLEHVRQSILLIDKIHNATGKKHGHLHESVMNSLDIAGQDAKKWRGLCK
jgi:hypothetical protein